MYKINNISVVYKDNSDTNRISDLLKYIKKDMGHCQILFLFSFFTFLLSLSSLFILLSSFFSNIIVLFFIFLCYSCLSFFFMDVPPQKITVIKSSITGIGWEEQYTQSLKELVNNINQIVYNAYLFILKVHFY